MGGGEWGRCVILSWFWSCGFAEGCFLFHACFGVVILGLAHVMVLDGTIAVFVFASSPSPGVS